ncbi:MAG: DUF1918 domain-containing protein [Actinomycetota bacterium]
MRATAGDRITVRGHRIGQPHRVGTVVEVRGSDGEPPFRVRWDGDHDAHLYVPGSDAVIESGEE